MNKREDDYITVCRKKAVQSDLHSEYRKMTEQLRRNPQSLGSHQEVLCEILSSRAEIHGELNIANGGKDIYFARDGTPLTDFGAIPLSVIKKFTEDGVEDDVELMILGKDIPSKIITLCAKELGSAQWLDNLGISYIYSKQEVWNIRVIIQEMAKYAPVREEFCYSGWAPDGDNFYVMNGHKLCDNDWYAEHTKTVCEHTLQMLSVAPHSITFVLLAVAILSLVQSRMISRGAYFKGVCSVVAQTQSFKTTIAALFFDWSDGRAADINFEASTAAIIRTIGNSRDKTVVLDDYKPGATKVESRDMLQKISRVIRLCSDNSGGIKRAGSQNETITNIARCLVVVTAEHMHFEVQSTLARLLILEMNGKDVDWDKLTFFQENHALYRECIMDFINYIIKQDVDIFCEKLEHQFLRKRNMLREELSDQNLLVDNRTSDMCTWLYIAFSEFLRFALSVKAIKQEEFENYMAETKKIFLSLMERQAERVAELDGVRQFFKGLQIILETKEAHIGVLQSRNTNYATKDSRSAIGFRKQGFVYLKNDVAFRKVTSYFQRYGREFAFSESDLRKKLADRDYINRKAGKGYIHRLFVNHESYQCIQFDKSKFEELVRGGKYDEATEREVPSNRCEQDNANIILGRGN